MNPLGRRGRAPAVGGRLRGARDRDVRGVLPDVGRVALDRRVLALRVRPADPARSSRGASGGTLGPMSRRAVGLCAAAGVCFAVDLITFHYAVDVIGAGLATVMGNLQVVIVALAAWALFGERPRERGAGRAAGDDAGRRPDLGGRRGRRVRHRPAAGRRDRRAHGDRVRRLPADHPARDAGPAPGRAGGDRDGGDRACAPGCSARRSATSTSRRACRRDAYLIALGVLSQSVGYLAIQVSLPRLPAVIASVLLLVQPVTTVFLGAILLRELPSPFQLAGVALVIAGIALATGSLGRIRTAIGAGAGSG